MELEWGVKSELSDDHIWCPFSGRCSIVLYALYANVDEDVKRLHLIDMDGFLPLTV